MHKHTKKHVHHTRGTILSALVDIDRGTSMAETARKYNVHYNTVLKWRKTYGEATPKKPRKVRKVKKTLTKAGFIPFSTEPITIEGAINNAITVVLDTDTYESLKEIADDECRDVASHIKFLVRKDVRLRATKIPF